MPKCQYIDPAEVRKPGIVELGSIPLNQYKKSFAEEKKIYSKDALLGIYKDMQFIREFETMLQCLKKQGNYANKEFTYPGPSHLAIGEEATAVGQDRAIPGHELVKTAKIMHKPVTRTKMQMVGVGQFNLAADVF